MAVQEGKRVALITGSTSVDGIGYGIAKALAQVGYDIILQGRRSVADIEPMREEIESSFKVTCHYLKADLLQRAEIESLCSNIRTIYPDGIDVLVNNACLYGLAAIEEYPVDNWDDVLKVNVTAPFDLIRLTLGAMKKKGWGRIINISSILSKTTSPNLSAYVCSKHALDGLTK
ncbi:D-beta-hydroxybutyrate dehydrogenase-like, partial [Saccoglossus kowalevskii]